MIMMNTGNSDQVVAAGNVVTNYLVPIVLIRSCLAGMCNETIHMATPEVKPEEYFYYRNRIKITYQLVAGEVKIWQINNN